MMRKILSGEPIGLGAQITLTEKRTLHGRHLLRRHIASCGKQMRDIITSPRTLLLAGGVGLLIGILTREHSSALHEPNPSGARARRMLASVMSSIALIRTLFPLLRLTTQWCVPSRRRPTPSVDTIITTVT
jgi:hypothetical protein